MKKILLILILISCGCNNKNDEFAKEMENRKAKHEASENTTGKYADVILDFEAEKLALLSIIKDIPIDTLHFVLKDYISQTGFVINSTAEVDKIIDNISLKYNISKVKIASIIFSYNYEMLTRDEIEQNAIESSDNEINE